MSNKLTIVLIYSLTHHDVKIPKHQWIIYMIKIMIVTWNLMKILTCRSTNTIKLNKINFNILPLSLSGFHHHLIGYTARYPISDRYQGKWEAFCCAIANKLQWKHETNLLLRFELLVFYTKTIKIPRSLSGPNSGFGFPLHQLPRDRNLELNTYTLIKMTKKFIPVPF